MVLAVDLLIVLAVALVLLLILVGISGMLVNIGGGQLGIIERKYFGDPLPEGRVVATGAQVGAQARALRPGLNLLPPFLYRVSKVDMIVIEEDQVGIVEAIDGA